MLPHCSVTPYRSTVALIPAVPPELLVRRHALPPEHSLPSGTATTDHFLLGQSPLPCLLGVIRSVTSQAPLQVLLCSLSRKSWHSSEEGIWARISLLLFQRSSYEPGPICKGIKIAHSDSPSIPQSSAIVKDSEQPRVQWAKVSLETLRRSHETSIPKPELLSL